MADPIQCDLLLIPDRVATCNGPGRGLDALDIREGSVIAIAGGIVVGISDQNIYQAKETRRFRGTALPGLVDPHTHLVFAGSRADEFAKKMAGVDYQTIAAEGGGIMSTVRATREASEEELVDLATRRALAMRKMGVTSIEVKSGYGLSVEAELKLLRAANALNDIARISPTFLGAHTVPVEYRNQRAAYLEQVIEEQLPEAAKLAYACDVYCDEGAFTLQETRAVLTRAKELGLQTRAHAGQFKDLGAATLIAELGGLSADHLEDLSAESAGAMAANGIIGTLLPGAWRTLRQKPPNVAQLREAGVNMAIGTDANPGTSTSLDLPLCAALAVRDAGLTLEEAVLGITRFAGAATRRPNRPSEALGILRPGCPADIAIFDCDDPRALPYALGGFSAAAVFYRGEFVHEAPNAVRW